MLPRHARCVLSCLRCNGHSLLLGSYLSKIGRIENPSCSACGYSSQEPLISFCTVQLRPLRATHSLATLCLSTTSGPTLENCPASGAPWSPAMPPSLGRGWVTNNNNNNVANLTSDTPGLSEKDRIEMSLERLSQRFGVRGGFLSEPEIRKSRYVNKLVSSSANITKEFKDQLDQCLLYARAHNRCEKFEGSFVLDLA